MKTKIVIALIFSALVISCKNNIEQSTEKEIDLIKISKAQFESEKMTIGEAKLYPFADKVHFTGIIIPAIDGQAQISLPMPGIIDNIRCQPAQMINKGTVLFDISGHWFIDLQKEFSESSAMLSKYKSEYQRAKELYNEKINTQKDFTAAESAYYAENANYKALKTKLETIGLDIAKIEKGEFYNSFPIKSPINGYVSRIDASLGQYIEPQLTIAEIIDQNSFQVKLLIFEKDIHKIQTGQSVMFYLNANKTQIYSATLQAIGKTIMSDSKSIECFASINEIEDLKLVSNQYVGGEIVAEIDSALALPETAIINFEDEQYVLILEKEENDMYYFKKTKVNIGRRADNYIELTGNKQLKNILLTGTYNIVIE